MCRLRHSEVRRKTRSARSSSFSFSFSSSRESSGAVDLRDSVDHSAVGAAGRVASAALAAEALAAADSAVADLVAVVEDSAASAAAEVAAVVLREVGNLQVSKSPSPEIFKV